MPSPKRCSTSSAKTPTCCTTPRTQRPSAAPTKSAPPASRSWLGQKANAPVNDHEILRLFEDCSLPFSEWTHRAHIKDAYLYLRDDDYHTALAKMRRGVQAYNAAHDVPESDTTGYNETTTCAMMQIIATTIAA